jgi:hypothetical protein
MKRNIEVRWKQGPAAGYTDVFRADEFAKLTSGAERSHTVRGPHRGRHSARFKLTVKRSDAEMDYSAFPEYNKRHGMDRGVMRFRFTDPARTRVKSLWWDSDLVEPNFAEVVTVWTKEPTSPGELAFRRRRTTVEVFLRRGQVEFRRKLDLMYGSKCCISGCTVSWALEAAHIVPYKDSQSDAACNGLLLRSDLHALFDAGHLAIDPDSKRVWLSAEAQGWKEYGDLHGSAVLASPQPGFENDAPNAGALRKRYERFLKNEAAYKE